MSHQLEHNEVLYGDPEARIAVVSITYEIPIDLANYTDDLTEDALQDIAASVLEELIAGEGVQALDPEVRYFR